MVQHLISRCRIPPNCSSACAGSGQHQRVQRVRSSIVLIAAPIVREMRNDSVPQLSPHASLPISLPLCIQSHHETQHARHTATEGRGETGDAIPATMASVHPRRAPPWHGTPRGPLMCGPSAAVHPGRHPPLHGVGPFSIRTYLGPSA